MTHMQARYLAIGCGFGALIPAVLLAGVLGIEKAHSGLGFWPFLIWISALLVGFVIPNHLAPQKPKAAIAMGARARACLIAIAFGILLLSDIKALIQNFIAQLISPYAHLLPTLSWFILPISLIAFNLIALFKKDQHA